MANLKVVICDSDRQELEGHANICREVCEQNGVSAEFKLYSNTNEILFDMDDDKFSATVSIFIIDPENGFDPIPFSIREKGYNGIIIYLSNSKSLDHYRQAFDVGAFNFLEKGADPPILSRFKSVFGSALQSAEKPDRHYLAVSYAGEFKRIPIQDILYFETASNMKINIVYKGGSFEYLSTMQSLEKRFSNRGFVRVHRSYLVSIDAIHRVDRNGLTLNNGHRISVSRDRQPSLKAAMFCWQS